MKKICSFCNIEKNLELFSNDQRQKDGKRPNCKLCKAISDKKYKESNKIIENHKKILDSFIV